MSWMVVQDGMVRVTFVCLRLGILDKDDIIMAMTCLEFRYPTADESTEGEKQPAFSVNIARLSKSHASTVVLSESSLRAS